MWSNPSWLCCYLDNHKRKVCACFLFCWWQLNMNTWVLPQTLISLTLLRMKMLLSLYNSNFGLDASLTKWSWWQYTALCSNFRFCKRFRLSTSCHAFSEQSLFLLNDNKQSEHSYLQSQMGMIAWNRIWDAEYHIASCTGELQKQPDCTALWCNGPVLQAGEEACCCAGEKAVS